MPRPARRRLIAALALVATVATGLAVHRWAADTAASDIAGDALYALAAYAGLVMIFPRPRPWLIAVAAGAWCTAVELLQLTGAPERLGAAFPPAMLLLGTVFDPRDLLVYLLTIAVAVLADTALAVGVRRRRPLRRPTR
ncbi:DUF2809 domain-containing protein [Microbacterium sp. zg.Y1090]|uniref:ribosomal maturation YjgA family protein n=1 Tax=Microbacterium wangruii TaxID=3049073 RepID=UPI00214D9726|nr:MULTISPECIES: DUF2809 domain-containing protein [unclassified Microbacterium]MCR2819902.1 DUF2809 domain-containing protein [Microbacterium sp. zg.Y1090]WIM27490.1 DUF2809 domain-containing protein [Microbacterium sp. zg-Y1090]